MTDIVAIFAIILSVVSVAVSVYTLLLQGELNTQLTSHLDNIKQDTTTGIDRLRNSLDGWRISTSSTCAEQRRDLTTIWNRLHGIECDLKPLKRLSDIENTKALLKTSKEVAAHWDNEAKIYQDRLKNLQKEAKR